MGEGHTGKMGEGHMDSTEKKRSPLPVRQFGCQAIPFTGGSCHQLTQFISVLQQTVTLQGKLIHHGEGRGQGPVRGSLFLQKSHTKAS